VKWRPDLGARRWWRCESDCAASARAMADTGLEVSAGSGFGSGLVAGISVAPSVEEKDFTSLAEAFGDHLGVE
jgi:hypothetical protein